MLPRGRISQETSPGGGVPAPVVPWKRIALLCIAAAALALLAPDRPASGQRRMGMPDGPSASSRLMPLVPVDEELDEYLHEAQGHIDNKRYAQAIEVLQSLIAAGNKVFHQPDEGVRRYVPIRAAATELLGHLPQEGLVLYRQLYDPKAALVFQEAERTGDSAALRRVVAEYFQTSYGDRAADLLGTLEFDEGHFLDAAYQWETIVEQHRGGSVNRALLAAKAATAYHLGGEPAKAAELLKVLKAKYPEAEGTIAGRTESLAAFVEKVLASAPPALLGTPTTAAGWPSFAGSPTGLAWMAVCDKATFPLWRQPATADEGLDLSEAVLGFPSQPQGAPAPQAASVRARAKRGLPLKIEVKDAQVVVTSIAPERRMTAAPAPIMIHPIVVGDLVLYRNDQEVVACELATGEIAWRSVRLPVLREARPEPWLYQLASMGLLPADTGRYTLTAGRDKVYAVAKFPILMPRGMLPGGAKAPSESSSLVALSLPDRGKVVWEVGNGAGTSDVVREARFPTAPAYAAGRLYTTARRLQSLYALCLDAETGATVWETAIGQTGGFGPNPFQGFNPATMYYGEQGSPPAVGGGRVFVTTNAGLVACLAADTGEPIWNYQYESTYRNPRYGRTPNAPLDLPFPPNPVLLLGGRVVCLPADSGKVLALRGETGEVLWEADRQKQHDLAALDEGRLLVSGPQLRVLRVRDGGLVVAREVLSDIAGRPAVGPETALACGQGRFYRLNLATYDIEEARVADDQALLGGLVSSGGRVVAATAAGLCAYFTYEDAWKSLETRLQRAASPTERLAVLLKRGRFALLAGQLERAHAEFQAAAAMADGLPDEKSRTELRSWMHRLGVRCAGLAKTDEETGRYLEEARSYTFGPVSEAELALRFMRYHEKYGRFAQAARMAQNLTEKFPQVRLRDVALGSDDPPLRDDEQPPMDGYTLGHRHIERLIAEHRREVYAEFDALAREALEKGKAEGDAEALLAAHARYPRSPCADRLLLAAGEALYRGAVAKPSADEKVLARAARVLGELCNLPGSPVALQAQAGEALIDSRRYPHLAGVLHAELWKADARQQVDFGDFHGTVEQLRERLTAGASAAGLQTPHFREYLAFPLREVYRVKDMQLMVLRDAEGAAVRVGPRLFLRNNEKIYCLDTRANEFREGSAVLWTAPLQWPVPAPSVGCLIQGGQRLAVATGQHLVLLEAATGNEVYRRTLREQDASDWMTAAADGERMYFGRPGRGLICVNLADGEVAWQTAERTNDGMPYLLQLEGDVLLAQTSGMPRRIACHDARTGRLLLKILLAQSGEARLTPDGLLVVVDGNRVSLRDPYREDPQVLWQVAQPALPVGLLGVSRTHAAVTDPRSHDVVRLLDLAAGGRAAGSVPLRGPKGNALSPIAACFEGSRMYVLSGMSQHDMYYYGNALNVQAPAFQAVEWASGKTLWTTSLSPGDNLMTRVRLPVLADQHLSTFVAGQDPRQAGAAVLLVKLSGTLAQIPPPTDLAGVDWNMAQQRANSIGGPVVVNGRLLVEEPTGLVLLRSPL